jgi:hypothetical protein
LGLLWTPTINKADSILRQDLKPFKAKNSGGSEWYEIKPKDALNIILGSLMACREPEHLHEPQLALGQLSFE